MTFRHHGQAFLKDIWAGWDNLTNADNELAEEFKAGTVFIEKALLDKRSRAYGQWESAQNQLNALCSHMIKNKLSWDDEFICG